MLHFHWTRSHMTSHHMHLQSELPQSIPRIPWSQTTDVHRGSTLIMRVIMWRCRYITSCWRHNNHVNTITRVIAAKQTVLSEVYVFFNKISLKLWLCVTVQIQGGDMALHPDIINISFIKIHRRHKKEKVTTHPLSQTNKSIPIFPAKITKIVLKSHSYKTFEMLIFI